MAARQQPLRKLVIVLDTLDESCAASLRRDGLSRFSGLLALSAITLQPFHVGLCTIFKLDNGRDVQLKVPLRPGPFQLREFHCAVAKLGALISHGPSEPTKTALALGALVTFLTTRSAATAAAAAAPAEPLAQPLGLETTICLVARRLEAEPLRRCIAVAAEAGIQIQFVFIGCHGDDDPTDGLEAAVSAAPPVGNSMSSTEHAEFSAAIADCDNATVEFCPPDPYSLQLLATGWFRSLALPPPRRLSLRVSETLSLKCTAHCEVLPLVSWLEPAATCPCHGAALPLQPATATGAVGAACPLTGASLQPSECPVDMATVRVGSASVLYLTKADKRAHRPPAPTPAVPIALQACYRFQVGSLSETLVVGPALVLVPNCEGLIDVDEMQSNEAAMAALCQALRESGEALLVKARMDLATGKTSPWDCLYAARPAASFAMLSLTRIASLEEYIPLDVALPAAGAPDAAAMAGARLALTTLQVAGYGPGLIGDGLIGGYVPINCPSGAGELLSELLASSQPTPIIPPTARQGPSEMSTHAEGAHGKHSSKQPPDLASEARRQTRTATGEERVSAQQNRAARRGGRGGGRAPGSGDQARAGAMGLPHTGNGVHGKGGVAPLPFTRVSRLQ